MRSNLLMCCSEVEHDTPTRGKRTHIAQLNLNLRLGVIISTRNDGRKSLTHSLVSIREALKRWVGRWKVKNSAQCSGFSDSARIYGTRAPKQAPLSVVYVTCRWLKNDAKISWIFPLRAYHFHRWWPNAELSYSWLRTSAEDRKQTK